MKYVWLSIVVLLLFTGCQPAQDEFLVGASVSLTGFGASWGENIRNGLELAKEEINANGGINGKPVRIIYEDFGAVDLKKAVGAAQKFTGVDNVDVIMTQWAEDTEVIAPIAIEKNVLLVNIASGARTIPEMAESVFMVIPTEETVWFNMIDYMDDNQLETGVIIVEPSAYYESALVTFEQLWGERPTLKIMRMNSGQDDVRPLLLQVENEDFVLVDGNVQTSGRVMKVAKELGIDTQFIGLRGMAVPEFFEASGDAANGLVYPEFAAASDDFTSKYEEKYGVAPGIASDYAYDALMVVAEATKQGTSTEELIAGMRAIENYPGVSGSITFTEEGERLGKDVYVMQIQDGKSVRVA